MREDRSPFSRRLLNLGFCSLFLVACIGLGCSSSADATASDGSGGKSGSGGTTGSGGTNGSGGSSSGGNTASGGSGSGGQTTSSGGSGSGGSGSGGSASGGSGSGGRGSGGAASGGSGSGGSASGGNGNQGGAGTGTGAAGGAGPATSCTITPTATMGMIPTVGIVTYTTDLKNVKSGEIQFGLPGGAVMKAPIDTTKSPPRTLMLGMKAGKAYTYRVALTSDAGTCTSADAMFMTGALPSTVAKPTVAIMNAASHDKGFILTSGGVMGTATEILDADGEVVWWATGPAQNSRSHMSWDGSRMYMMSLNVQNSGAGKIISLAMDGSDSQTATGVEGSHHDMTAIPGGFATPMWNSTGMDAPCSLVEFKDGTWAKTVVVADFATIYASPNNRYHTNAVHYYAADDSYTVGDRNPNSYVKITRKGQLVWQFGGSSPKGASFTGVTAWQVNHGHHLLPDGTFYFFNNNAAEALGYKLDTAKMTATKSFTYTASGASSMVLGDVQSLPNGNVLVTYSNSAQIHEVSPSGTLVMKITGSSASGYGYTEFRESLYGPPPY